MEYVLSLGSNLGNRLDTLKFALDRMVDFAQVLQRSSVYCTAPWGTDSTLTYLNQVVRIETNLQPMELLKSLQSIENAAGRTRSVLNADRTLDIDILLQAQHVFQSEHLTIPHPRLQERNFVLVPLAEIMPTSIHPVLNSSFADLLKESRDPLAVSFYA